MRCIFCLNERPSSKEHVFPRAIGGTLTTDRVCMTCNSYLGKRVDVELSNNFIMKGHRAKLRLAGNSGKPPPIYESLVGIGKLASNPEQRVEITFDKITQKPVVRMLPHISDVIMPNGNKARRIVVDQKDTGELAKNYTTRTQASRRGSTFSRSFGEGNKTFPRQCDNHRKSKHYI